MRHAGKYAFPTATMRIIPSLLLFGGCVQSVTGSRIDPDKVWTKNVDEVIKELAA